MTAVDTAATLKQWIARTDAVLDRLLPSETTSPARLHEAIRYSVLSGGKRLRPLLVFATGRALGVNEDALDHAAAAVEMIHAYSLIHDDLPAMDDDDLRRGRPTVHIAFDEATAILAGDALQTLAFAALTDAPLDASKRIDMLRALTLGSGTLGMVGGQALDLAAVGQQIDEHALIEMHARKTGALITACAQMAAAAAGADAQTRATLDRFAAALGLAFQIRDDLLDVEASSAQLGKTAGKDAAADKPTYVSMLSIDAARERLHEQASCMHAALADLPGDVESLRALALMTVERTH